MRSIHLTTRVLFEYLQMRESATVPEIAARLRMASPTVTGLLTRLTQKGLVSRSEPVIGRRGRPRTGYRLRLPGIVASCDWDGTQLSGALFDENLNALAIHTEDLLGLTSLAQALSRIDGLVNHLCNQRSLRRKQLPGLALSLNAASIDGQTVTSSVIPWANEHLGQALADALQLPVRLLLNQMIIAEYAKLPDPAPRSMVLLRAGDGVSAHSIEASQRMRGRHFLAGELGHITVDQNGALCGCGRRGCLETICSGPAIYRRTIEDLRHGVTSELTLSEFEKLSPRAAMERIWQAWDAGDTFAHAVMDRVFDSLAWGVGLIVNLFDPDILVAGGYVLKDRPAWVLEVERRAQRWILHAPRRHTTLTPAQATREDEMRVVACGFHPHAIADELVLPQAPSERSKRRRAATGVQTA